MIEYINAASDLNQRFPSIIQTREFSNLYFENKYFLPKKNLSWQDLKPGLMYTFDYLPPYDPKISNYIDRRPIIIVIPQPSGYPKFKLFGINLNLVKPQVRMNFLSTLSNLVGIYYTKDGSISKDGDYMELLSKLNINSARVILKDYPIERIVKGFDLKYISGFSEISIADWIYIPFIDDFKIEGTSINRIYNA